MRVEKTHLWLIKKFGTQEKEEVELCWLAKEDDYWPKEENMGKWLMNWQRERERERERESEKRVRGNKQK